MATVKLLAASFRRIIRLPLMQFALVIAIVLFLQAAHEHSLPGRLFDQLLAGAGPSGPQGPQGQKGESVVGPPGKLPIVQPWRAETVFYHGDVVTYEGGMFQALRDTGQPPHHCDWICLACGGRDAKNFTVRGVYRVGERYQALDIVSKNGGSFIARCDDPGECPGDGWANVTMPGKRGAEGPVGPKGDKGDQGAKGDAAPTILEWVIDCDNYRAIPLMSVARPPRRSSYGPCLSAFSRR